MRFSTAGSHNSVTYGRNALGVPLTALPLAVPENVDPMILVTTFSIQWRYVMSYELIRKAASTSDDFQRHWLHVVRFDVCHYGAYCRSIDCIDHGGPAIHLDTIRLLMYTTVDSTNR
jgi:hypothetical protein